MKELYDLTATEVIGFLVDDVMAQHKGLTKKEARKLVLNALIYNVVTSEVYGQIDFLMGVGEYAEEED